MRNYLNKPLMNLPLPDCGSTPRRTPEKGNALRITDSRSSVQRKLLRGILSRALAFGLGCLLFLLPSATPAASPPPVGVWDCVVGGSQRGVAHIFFSPDGTLSGNIFLTFVGRASGTFTNTRGGTFTNFFGGAQLDGRWSYASPGNTSRFVGFINEVSRVAGTTTAVSNGLSFSATARASRLTLSALGYQGRLTFRGIPLQQTNDLSGTYYANVRKQGAPAPMVEAFDVFPVPKSEDITTREISSFDCSSTNITTTTNSFSITNDNVISEYVTYLNYVTITQQVCYATNTVVTTIYYDFRDNYYGVFGRGPGYDYDGLLLVSRQNYAAFYQAQGENAEIITVYAGPFNPATGRGSLVGTDGVSRNIKCAISPGTVPAGP